MKDQASSLSYRSLTLPRLAGLSILSIVLAFGCGNDGDSQPTVPSFDTGRYVVSTSIFLPDSNFTLLLSVDSLEEGTEVDYETALEFGGVSNIFPYKNSVFAQGLNEEPVLIRYDRSDGRWVESARLSMANLGIASGFNRAGRVPIFDDERGWFIDQDSLTVVVFNPTDMTLIDSFSLEALRVDGYSADLEYYPNQRGDQLLIAARYRNFEAGTWLGRSAVATLSISQNRLLDVAIDETCGDILHSARAPNGDIYYASGSLGTAAQLVLGDASGLDDPPCMRRVRAGETQFDPTFRVELADLAGGRPAGLMVPGEDDRVYIRAVDTTLLDLPAAEDFRADVWRQPAWSWYEVVLGEEQADRRLDGIPLSSGVGNDLRIDGTTYLTQVDGETNDTTLVRINENGTLTRGITLRGFPYNIVGTPTAPTASARPAINPVPWSATRPRSSSMERPL